MDLEQIKALIAEKVELTDLELKADGSHYEVIAVGEIFEGMRSVKRQQTIYAPLMEIIADGSMHAVSIKAFTPEEYRKHKLLNF
ncbi:BolA family transcriptional regulator [Catenovulum sp. SM1970]|uniref:BolA family protein n=1 Tax=Marinifaba aquimaris TaxID=2741323 RepID=UPI001573166A|nr:BolA family protein [Marinifaba aquimaris]NTS75902.1 BolA family transcriptional regulator [Marinifaba aquimaris]